MKRWARGIAKCVGTVCLGLAVLDSVLPESAHASTRMITDPALGMPDATHDWQTLATPHFNIHFEHDQRAFAERLAAIAERVHTTLTPRAAYLPPGKTEVVINDSVDISNGGATVLPYRQFFIYMTPPTSGELMDDADWVEMVFTHEYMHILHIDQAAGFPGGLRKVIGRWFFTFPQVFNPSWVTEGYAVWAETDHARAIGRGQSALYDAAMRGEVMNGLKDLSSLSFHGYSGTDWPHGQSYLYGLYFFQFIESTWGKDKIREFIAAWNRNIIPFRMDGRAQRVFGMDAEALHERFLAYLKQRFEPDINAWQAQHGNAPVYALAGDGYREQVHLDDAGGAYYYENNGRTAAAILHRDSNGKIKTLAEAKTLQQFDVHPQAGIVMSALRICNNIDAYADLYKLEDGDWRAITDCGRYLGGYWSPLGDRIAAVAIDDGKQRLELLDANGKRLQVLYQAPLGETLGSLTWHPQGQALVVMRKPQGERWGLYRWSLTESSWQALPTAGGMVRAPRYDETGEHLYFIDAHQQRLNVRKLTLATGQVTTLTETLTAVTDFAVKKNQLVTLEYTAQGIALATQPALDNDGITIGVSQARTTTAPVNLRENSEKDNEPAALPDKAPAAALPPFEPPAALSASASATITSYSPWQTLMPTSWLVLAGADSEDNGWIQFMTSGSDVLGFHAWQLAPRHYYDRQTLGGDIAYVAYKRLALLGTRSVSTEEDSTDTQPAILEIEDRAQMIWMQPLNDFDTAWQLNIGVASERSEFEIDEEPIAEPYKANLAGLSLSLDSTDYYLYSISPEDGRRIKLTAEKYDALGGGLFRGDSYALDWNEYFTTWNNQVLALRWVEARADDEARAFELGGFHDSFETLASLIGFGKTTYPLRGYETGLAALRGDNLRLQTLEYRLPVATIFDGFMAPPVGVGKISASVFYDRGAAWNDQAERRYYAGAGAEVNTEVLLGFNMLSLNITVGAAQGLDDTLGTSEAYVRLGAAF